MVKSSLFSKLAISPKLSAKSLVLWSARLLYLYDKVVFKVQLIMNVLANYRSFLIDFNPYVDE